FGSINSIRSYRPVMEPGRLAAGRMPFGAGLLLFVDLLRRVRWANVGRLAALVAAAALAAGMAGECGAEEAPAPREAAPAPRREVPVPKRDVPAPGPKAAAASKHGRTAAVKTVEGRKRVTRPRR